MASREAVYRAVKSALLDLKAAEPDLIDAVRAALRVEDECGGCPWDAIDIARPPKVVRKLVNYGLVVGDGGQKYRLIDREAVRRALNEMNLAPRPRSGPAFDADESMFDGVVGYERVKRIIVMALRARNPVHVLLVGPPGTGKTLIMDSVRSHLEERGACVASAEGGKGLTTSVGIVELVLQMPPETPCLLIIDEIDKLEKTELAPLYRLMVTGEIVLAKHNRIVRQRRRVWVLASSNRAEALPQPILSRFIEVKIRELTPEAYKAVVPAILVKREGVDEELARYIAESLSRYTTDPRDAITIARMAHTREDVDFLVESLFVKKHRAL